MSVDLSKVTGLKNIGNTCYLNSSLQLLINTDLLTQFFINNEFKNKELKGYRQTLIDYYTPKVVCLAPNIVKRYIADKSMVFRGFGQNDANEFMVHLIDTLDERLKEELKENSDINGINCEAKDVFANLFDIGIESKIISESTNEESITNTKERFLPLEIPEKNGEVNLDDCLENFQRIEDMDNLWRSEKTKEMVNIKKKLTIKSLPKYLIITLKRYSFSNGGRKINTQVNIPLEYNFMGKNYSLKSCVLQSGSLRGGHYISFIKKDNQWYCCNDSRVGKVNDATINEAVKNCYMFLFINN